MDLKTMTFIVVGLTFAIYIFIAIRARAASTSEFYVAGTGVHPVLNGMATGADWMSAASFISMAGLIAFAGYDASVYLMGWTGGYVLLALLLVPTSAAAEDGVFANQLSFEDLEQVLLTLAIDGVPTTLVFVNAEDDVLVQRQDDDLQITITTGAFPQAAANQLIAAVLFIHSHAQDTFS